MISIAALLVAIAVLWLRPAWTPAISSPTGVASLEALDINGSRQWILIRGQNHDNPVLLFLHGGPGMPAMYLAHASTRGMEKDFVVVHWDRRDAGKSFDARMSPRYERVSQQLADAEALIGWLHRRFGERRIFLVAHSWGTYLGVLLLQRHPEWFAAYVGTGQQTDVAKERAVADRFILSEAERRSRNDALVQMRTQANAHREDWLFRFGAELHRSTSFLPLLATGLLAPEYTMRDAMNVAKGPQYAARHMQYDVIDVPLSEAVNSVGAPVFFFEGRHDYVTPSELASAYLAKLAAPCKAIVWFENSAHFPFFEEPEHFAQAMRDVRVMPCVAARIGKS